MISEFAPLELKKLLLLEAASAIEWAGSRTDSAPVDTRWVKIQGAEKAGNSKKNAPMEAVGPADAHLARINLRRGTEIPGIHVRRGAGPNFAKADPPRGA